MGLKAPAGGRRRGRWYYPARDERERVLRMIDDIIDNLPAPPTDRPVEQWTAAELLADNTRIGQLRLREIIGREITEDMDPKRERLIGEMSLGVSRLYANVQIAGLQAAQDRGREKFDRALAEYDAKKAAKGAAQENSAHR